MEVEEEVKSINTNNLKKQKFNQNNNKNNKNNNNNERGKSRIKKEQQIDYDDDSKRSKKSIMKDVKEGPTKKQIQKYGRNSIQVETEDIKNKKTKSKIVNAHKKKQELIQKVAQTELLLPTEAGFLETETEMEKTWKVTQKALVEEVDLQTATKKFELKLHQSGPYSVDISQNGRHILLGGHKGHVAVFNWAKFQLESEINLNETVRDAIFLHDHTFYAAAQSKYLYIYDGTSGAEVHCLRNHLEPTRLCFLKYHFLLSSINTGGVLRYQDTSIGAVVADHYTGFGYCDTMALNPWNAIVHLGHTNGTVTLWSPNMSKFLVKMKCQRGAIKSIAIDREGKYMVTSSIDATTKIWDIRTYQELFSYKHSTIPSELTLSDRGLLAIGMGSTAEIWKDVFTSQQTEPYMKHRAKSAIERMKFVPFEDILGIGHRIGYESIIIPGSAEPNFDTFEANPYETGRQRSEREVHALLEKLSHETIAVDPTDIGRLMPSPQENLAIKRKMAKEANRKKLAEKFEKKAKKSGNDQQQKKKTIKKFLRKEKFIKKQMIRKSKGVAKFQKETAKEEPKQFASSLDQALSRFGRGK